MVRHFRYILVVSALLMAAATLSAQTTDNIRGLHKTKKKETIFGISRMYDITIDQLMDANPEMRAPGYELKKGSVLRIPWPTVQPQQEAAAQPQQPATTSVTKPDDLKHRALRLGVMLPLHDQNGDGRRMVEYYRGVLMAVDSLKKLGVSVDVRAWNTPEDGNLQTVLSDDHAAECDLIIGPLYSKQVGQLSAFAEKNDIKLLIPFSITAPQVSQNSHLYQVYQTGEELNQAAIAAYVDQFKGCHTIFVDCNDSTSRKGSFTMGLRPHLDQRGMTWQVTNLRSTEENFSKAFNPKKKNVVILNSGRSPELGVAFSKINGLMVTNPDLDITMFGYMEWLTYTRAHLDNFYKFNTYVPSSFYYNPVAPATQRLQQKYRANFRTDMQNRQPRFAITGFDHAFFFLRGLHKYGKSFNGTTGKLGYTPIQTPLQFEREGDGGYRNRMFLFVHYKPEHIVEVINKK